MNMDYLFLPIGIVCLWAPSSLMASASVKTKIRQGIRRNHEGLASLLRCRLNWIDLVRAALGAWLVQHYVASFHDLDSDTRWIPTAAEVAILSIGVLAQIVWLDRKLNIIGPVFFLAGLTMVVCGPLVGGFSLVLALNCALMFRKLGSCFLFGPASVAAFALLFHQLGLLTVIAASLFALPLVLAFATGSRLAFVRTPLPPKRALPRAPAPASFRFPTESKPAIPSKEEVISLSEGSFESEPPFPAATPSRFQIAATGKK